MINMIKMDLYRLFRTKSMYVIWLILAALIVLTTCFCKSDYEYMLNEDVAMSEQTVSVDTENVNIGMNVELPTKPGEKVTVFDIFFANSQGKFYTLFMVIFAIIFATADISSGYIKNIAGQVKSRKMLIISKAVSLAVYTVITLIGAFVLQIISNAIVFGEVAFGNVDDVVLYLGIQLILHYAIVVICMTIAIIIRNNVISMVMSICLVMNIMSIIYMAVNKIIEKMGIKNFQIYKYTVTGELSFLPMNPTVKESIMAACVGIGFIIIMLIAGSTVFQKRDI